MSRGNLPAGSVAEWRRRSVVGEVPPAGRAGQPGDGVHCVMLPEVNGELAPGGGSERPSPAVTSAMAGAPPSVSIVIPTLNAGRAFGTVLHRIMGQGRTPLEIVCADSGSTHGTRHIVSQFPLARFVAIAEPAGPRSWNRELEETRGDNVVYLAKDASTEHS